MKSKIDRKARQISRLAPIEQELVKAYYKDKPWTLLGEQRSLFKNCSDFPLFAQAEDDKQQSLFD